MAKQTIKLTRKVSGQSSSVEMTDELYEKLSKSQQFLASLAEACGIEPRIGEYQSRYFVAGETVDSLVEYFS